MSYLKVKPAYPQSSTVDLGKCPYHPYDEICLDRWADVQLDVTLEAIDQGVEGMVNLSKVATENADHSTRENALDDLEAAAYAVTRELRKALALDPTRVAALPFDPGHLLSEAVGQYLPYLPSDVRKTIVAGAGLAEECTLGALRSSELSEMELSYREWAISQLMRHLVYS